MRYDTDHKQQTRARVLDAAAKAIRIAGPDRVGVAGVMAEAGLTHGGFYAHFASKDELVTAAIAHMFEQAGERLRVHTEGRGPGEGIVSYIDFYLSRKHRDARGFGCPMAALSSDLPRLTDEARKIFSAGARRLGDTLAGKLAELGRADADVEGRSVVAEMIGALSLSRVEKDAKQSDAILETSKRSLKRRLGLEAHA
jgi:TetR/AcrR family transcriptional regulator, transcriptional repressor for nem operon